MPLKTPGTSAAPVVTKTPTSATTTPATGATPAKQTTAQPHKPVQSFPATSPSTPIFGSASGNASATKPTTVTASPSAATVAVKPAKKVKLPPNPKAEVDDDVWRCVQCDCPGNLTPIKRIGKSGKRVGYGWYIVSVLLWDLETLIPPL